MVPDIRTVIQALHDHPARVALVITGAGSRALAWLLGVAGASRTVLEAVVPYSYAALSAYLGWEPERVVTAQAARTLAAVAYARARGYAPSAEPLIGVSCTATIATDRPKRGAHRCHIGVWDGKAATIHSLVLRKGLRDRDGEEEIVSRLLIHALAAACGLEVAIPLELAEGESVVTTHEAINDPLARLFEGSVGKLTYYGADVFVADEPLRGAILPGSFNPLHEGHIRLAQVAEARLGQRVIFEISVHNVDKPSLTREQVMVRVRQFAEGPRRVVLTGEPLYAGKAALFPGCTFVIGYDTAQRLIDPAYYGGDPQQMLAALGTVRAAGCRFLVAGRQWGGMFRTLADLPLPAGYEDLFEGLPEEVLHVDLSSTELRARGL